ncbi:MAG: fibrobacter succinogenes major paralogous domain-containing protein [Candidatus Marinimicrobia bacterium]|nr:fibrobacter succinogenes major paralogous domain-containing protein [Candidatus Neomarinimicrobiota bacterium]MCF7903581.1 fibrobacter succinogenes major paralogous domain-containing protein [Candidatus Neomarinimicrobiota bacterium]
MAAFPGGYRNNNNGNFNNMGNNANFWSSTENNSNNAWNRKLNYNNANVNRNNNNKQNGFSVRLVRDLSQSIRAGRSIMAVLPHFYAIITL